MAYSGYFRYIESYNVFVSDFLYIAYDFKDIIAVACMSIPFSGPTSIPLSGSMSYLMCSSWWAFEFLPRFRSPEWRKHSGTCFCLVTAFNSSWSLLREGIAESYVISIEFCCYCVYVHLLCVHVGVHSEWVGVVGPPLGCNSLGMPPTLSWVSVFH